MSETDGYDRDYATEQTHILENFSHWIRATEPHKSRRWSSQWLVPNTQIRSYERQ